MEQSNAEDSLAPARMLERYYGEYRQLARRVLSGDGAAAYIQPTELAHEAALRIFRMEGRDLAGRTHFLALSVRMMRQVLIDEVRRHRAQKRQLPPVLTQWSDEPARPSFDIEAFHEALKRLADIDPERAGIVEQRFFAGLTIEDIARISGVSESTVKRRWRTARAWLIDELSDT